MISRNNNGSWLKRKRFLQGLGVGGVIALMLLTTTGTVFAAKIDVFPGGSIQTAIDSASPGDVIIVHAGTYTEQLTITKSLTIKGEAGTIIQAPSTLTPDSFGRKNIIEIGNGATVAISGFTISGPGSTNCGSIHAGIFVVGGATLKIKESTITEIHDTPAGGCQNGVGIFVGRQFNSQVGHAIIQEVTITKYQKGGIVVDGSGSTATIKNNIVDWGFTPFNIASNGIQVSRGAVATVMDNTVTGNICAAPSCGPNLLDDTQATGILLFQAGSGTVVKENEVSNNDVGIFVYQSPSDVQVKENKVSGNIDAGIALANGDYTASENMVSGPGNVGIAVIADVSNTSATLKENVISGVTIPIQTFAAAGLTATFQVIG